MGRLSSLGELTNQPKWRHSQSLLPPPLWLICFLARSAWDNGAGPGPGSAIWQWLESSTRVVNLIFLPGINKYLMEEAAAAAHYKQPTQVRSLSEMRLAVIVPIQLWLAGSRRMGRGKEAGRQKDSHANRRN